jgi:protein-S-isoprenylcysteine O-methyltransferase Ste14
MGLAIKVKRTIRKEDLAPRFLQLFGVVLAFSMVFSGFLKDTPLGTRAWPDAIGVAVIGNVITVLGLVYAVWSRLHLGRNWSGRVTIKEDHELIRTGPYRFSRHPIYTGIIAAFAGSAITAGEWRGLLGLALLVFVYVNKLHREEVELEKHFGEAYAAFRREVKALIPFVY